MWSFQSLLRNILLVVVDKITNLMNKILKCTNTDNYMNKKHVSRERETHRVQKSVLTVSIGGTHQAYYHRTPPKIYERASSTTRKRRQPKTT